jgi:hypothetical protein
MFFFASCRTNSSDHVGDLHSFLSVFSHEDPQKTQNHRPTTLRVFLVSAAPDLCAWFLVRVLGALFVLFFFGKKPVKNETVFLDC